MLTSIKIFPIDIFFSLNTITTDLEHFEIGHCDLIPYELPFIIGRLSNLKKLRMENICGNFTKELFNVVNKLKELRSLELININFNDFLDDGLENCVFITAFLIIPTYKTHVSINYCYF